MLIPLRPRSASRGPGYVYSSLEQRGQDPNSDTGQHNKERQGLAQGANYMAVHTSGEDIFTLRMFCSIIALSSQRDSAHVGGCV